MKEGGQAKFLERLANPEIKASMVEKMKEALRKRQSDDYSYAVIASYKLDPSFNGLNIVEAAAKLRGANSLDDQIETIFEIEKTGGATGVFHGMSDADLEAFMQHPNTMFASDSGVRKLGQDVPHPRGYGNNARILGTYVREKKVLRVEDAIRKMTSLPRPRFASPTAVRFDLAPGRISSSLILRKSPTIRFTKIRTTMRPASALSSSMGRWWCTMTSTLARVRAKSSDIRPRACRRSCNRETQDRRLRADPNP
jgi:N-acyl-D-amino-acid deacylase